MRRRVPLFIIFSYIFLLFTEIKAEDYGAVLMNKKIDVQTLTGLSDQVFDQDLQIISLEYPEIEASLKKNSYKQKEILQAVIASWIEMRAKEKISPLDRQSFKQNTLSLGIVQIKSQPAGAKIFVNGMQQQSVTDTIIWFKSAEVRISVSKEGYRDMELTKTIAPGKNSPVVFKLSSSQRRK